MVYKLLFGVSHVQSIRMKSVVLIISLVAVAFAAPEAPYPPSGWKPTGQQFDLPKKEYGTPTTENSAAATDVPPSEEPDSQGNPSRFSRLPGRKSAQFNQGSNQFFVITPEGSVQQLTIPTQQTTRTRVQEPESELVNSVQNNVPLGQLVRLPVTNSQLRQAPNPVRFVSSQPIEQPNFVITNAQSAKIQQLPQQAQFFALTTDGRLQPVQPRTGLAEADVQNLVQPLTTNGKLVLTSEGRFQRVQVQPIASVVEGEKLSQKEESGQYHVVLPSGKVQRVQYRNQISPENRLTSNAEYNEVQPISGPLYTFGSPLVRVV